MGVLGWAPIKESHQQSTAALSTRFKRCPSFAAQNRTRAPTATGGEPKPTPASVHSGSYQVHFSGQSRHSFQLWGNKPISRESPLWGILVWPSTFRFREYLRVRTPGTPCLLHRSSKWKRAQPSPDDRNGCEPTKPVAMNQEHLTQPRFQDNSPTNSICLSCLDVLKTSHPFGITRIP